MDVVPFSQLLLNDKILRSLVQEGYTTPTPVQSQAIPYLMAGRDLMATAQTGTGKTAAFALPLLHRLYETRSQAKGGLRALILTPTRELALQIDLALRTYGRHLGLRTVVVLGGVSMGPQIRNLRARPDILVATPGRLLDLFGQGYIRLGEIEALILDEADRMLDMGFLPDVRRILEHCPEKRQTMFFSATISPEIARLASEMLHEPARVEVSPSASVSTNIAQKLFFVDQANKRDLLVDFLKGANVKRSLVFTRTKHRADRLMAHLESVGISAETIHSNKSQNARQKALAAFDKGRVKVLVATDIVSRGIDVDGITHVINFELPMEAECYVHRIGRTARAGAEGVAMSFCDAEEIGLLRGIERLTKVELERVEDHPFHSATVAEMHRRGVYVAGPQRGGQNRGQGRSQGRSEGRSQGGRPQARPQEGRPQARSFGSGRPEARPQGARPQGRPFPGGGRPQSGRPARPEGRAESRFSAAEGRPDNRPRRPEGERSKERFEPRELGEIQRQNRFSRRPGR